MRKVWGYTETYMTNTSYPRFTQFLVILLIAFAGIAIVIIGKSFLVPIVLAGIFALFLMPLAELLERWHLHRRVATLLSLLVFLLVTVGVLSGISLLVRSFILDLPSLSSGIAKNLTIISEFTQRIGLGQIIDIQNIDSTLFTLLRNSTGAISSIVSGTTATITQITLTIVYTFFMLSYRDKLQGFMYKLAPSADHAGMKEIVHNMMRVVPQYLVGVFISALILAAVNSGTFALIGIHQPVFLGVLLAVLNIIPYVGPTVGFIFVIAFTLLTQSPLHALGVLIAFFVIQFFDNNILTPGITASRIKLNGLTAIIGIVAGGMIWGVVGMVLALPILAMIKIILASTKGFEPYAYLMGTEDTDEEGGEKKSSFLKRMFKK